MRPRAESDSKDRGPPGGGGAVLTRQHPFISDMVSKGPRGNQGRRGSFCTLAGGGQLRPSQPCSWHRFQGWELSGGFPV